MINTKELNAIIDSSGLKRGFISRKVGITRAALYNKINNKTEFTANEIAKICSVLNINDSDKKNEIFFANYVDKKETKYQ
ncbi:helix-turn-helix domain-containing protein [Peptoniphilus harei]|uniref:helix-turn-helix domain-containing protein n=1 Tax=Peptoniphilus harei TaxID=54005 RepID=UPI0011DDE4AB|nr:helix-turn-helix transcriptional regulator [Peptoniphilus harei]